MIVCTGTYLFVRKSRFLYGDNLNDVLGHTSSSALYRFTGFQMTCHPSGLWNSLGNCSGRALTSCNSNTSGLISSKCLWNPFRIAARNPLTFHVVTRVVVTVSGLSYDFKCWFGQFGELSGFNQIRRIIRILSCVDLAGTGIILGQGSRSVPNLKGFLSEVLVSTFVW